MTPIERTTVARELVKCARENDEEHAVVLVVIELANIEIAACREAAVRLGLVPPGPAPRIGGMA